MASPHAAPRRFSPRRHARIAGACYLSLILLGIVAEVIRDGTIVADNATTAANILAREQLWRLALISEFTAAIAVVGLVAIYFVLFDPVNRVLTLIATFMSLLGTGVQIVAVVNLISALLGAQQHLTDVVGLAVKSHSYGYGAALLLFGTGFLFRGRLIFTSGFLPKTIGILISIAGICYITNSLAQYLSPPLSHRLFPLILLPSFIGELSLCLWLLIKGVDEDAWWAVKESAVAS